MDILPGIRGIVKGSNRDCFCQGPRTASPRTCEVRENRMRPKIFARPLFSSWRDLSHSLCWLAV